MRAARIVLLATLVPAAAVGACTYFDEPEPYRPPAADVRGDAQAEALGRQVYQRDCSFCHGRAAQGTERGPDLVTGTNGPALTDFMLRTGRMPIDHPDEALRRSPSRYDDDEIAAVVAYLAEETYPPGPAIPELDLADPDLARGRELYQQHCTACHATTGIGGAMLAHREGERTGIAIPGIAESTPIETGEAIRTGPGAMPRFGPEIVDDDDLDALVGYVDELRNPDDRGGHPIGRVGPVVEGAVGWLIGLGLLVLFARWVGTTRRTTRGGRP